MCRGSFTVASMSARAAPWLNGRPAIIRRQLEIELVDSIAIGLAVRGGCFEESNIHSRSLDHHFGMIDRLAEEVVGPHRADYMIAGPIVAPRLAVLLSELDSHLELRQYIALNVESDLRCVHGLICSAHQRAKMIRAKVHLVGKSELSRGHSKAVRAGCLFEHLVAPRVFDLEGQRLVRGSLVIGSVKRKRTNMDRLPRLIDCFSVVSRIDAFSASSIDCVYSVDPTGVSAM